MSDARLAELLGFLVSDGDGFANNMIWKSELLAVLQELRRYREGAATK
jgi:hypothetical protein